MSTSWSAGYVSEINYTHGFYRELTPVVMAMAALTSGQAAPRIDGPLAYCELGCGQGVSSNILAAANPNIQFVATDFNPSQIAGARAVARDAGIANIRFLDDSFAEICERQDLPDFDIIALHGIYSWISAENRGHIVEFIRRRLKPGGLVYISYNTLPGWAPVMPLRRLFVEAAADQGGDILSRIDHALKFATEIAGGKARYFQINSGVLDRLNKIKEQPRSYLAHEYFNRDWTPFYHGDVVSELSAAKLSWITSAFLLDTVDSINLMPDQQALLAKANGRTRREELRDFLVNQQFRRDLFVKGGVSLNALQSRERWLGMRFVLLALPAQISLKVVTQLGEVTLQKDVYEPVLDVLSEGVTSFEALLSHPKTKAIGYGRLQQALVVLVGAGHAHPCLDSQGMDARSLSTDSMNEALMTRACATGDISFLASPVTGGGVPVERMAQMFLLAIKKQDPDPVRFIWNNFQMAGQRLMKGGVTLATEAENIEEINNRYKIFVQETLPVCRQLRLI